MKRLLLVISVLMMSVMAVPVEAAELTTGQEKMIVGNCNEIREQLKTVQKNDARARVYLGGRYEAILSKFIMPLNVRLVENNLPSAGLVEIQNNFAEMKAVFNNDYINYQQGLEELVATDCKSEPKVFYEKLEKVRQKRKIVEQDVLKMRNLISQDVTMVTELRSKL